MKRYQPDMELTKLTWCVLLPLLLQSSCCTAPNPEPEPTQIGSIVVNDKSYETTANFSSDDNTEMSVNMTMEVAPPITADQVLMPITLIFGLFGNFLSIAVMSLKDYRDMPLSLLVCFLSGSDSTVLIMEPFTRSYFWAILGTDIRSVSQLSCKIFYWFYISAKMTAHWFVVLITIERLIAVWLPLKAKQLSTKTRIVICSMVVYVVIGSFNAFWMSQAGILVDNNCVPNEPDPSKLDAEAAMTMTAVASFLCSFVPSIFILTGNLLIVCKLAEYRRKRKELKASNSRPDKSGKMTTMLIVLSCVFLLLICPTPIALIVFTKYGWNPLNLDQKGLMIAFEVLQIAERFKYCINFYVYVLFSAHFRRGVVKLFRCGKVGRKDITYSSSSSYRRTGSTTKSYV